MSVDLIPLELSNGTSTRCRVSRRSYRREQRRRANQDRLMAHLAELHRIRAVLAEAGTLVGSGWVQHGWFSVASPYGHQRVVTAQTLAIVNDEPVSGACLVGAIVHAGGGPAAVRTQLVQRTLDLTWHTLHEEPHRPVRWCPPPELRMAHVRDLTRWNDRPERTSTQVSELLLAAIGIANAQTALVRSR